jgi:hypothetical protein
MNKVHTARRDRRHVLMFGGVLAGAALAIVVAVGSASADSSTPGGMPAAKAARLNAELSHRVAKAPQKPTVTQGRARAQAKEAAQGSGGAMAPGIVNLRQGPFPASVFAGTNMYRTRIGSTWVLAFAGAALDGQGGQQAALRVYQQPDHGKLALVGVFAAKAASGPLTVLSAQAATITLGTADETTVTFDLVTLRYV